MIISKPLKKLMLHAVVCSGIFLFQANAQDKPKLSDPEVASVAVTANQIDISYAQIAKEKSKDSSILKFAETMSRDHNAVLNQAVALAKKLGVTPKDNPVSQKLLGDAGKTKTNLRSLSGKAFNKAYINNEVGYHKAVIAALEGLLIPQAENQELKGLLQSVVPAFKAHLMHAEMLQKNYN